MEKIKEYLQSNKITQKEFADRIGITVRALCRYLNASRMPTLVIAKKIEMITNGEITMEDLIDNWNQKQRMVKNDNSTR